MTVRDVLDFRPEGDGETEFAEDPDDPEVVCDYRRGGLRRFLPRVPGVLVAVVGSAPLLKGVTLSPTSGTALASSGTSSRD